MYRFFLKYQNGAEQEVFPITDGNFGMRIVENPEKLYNYMSQVTGNFVFSGDDFDFIKSVGNETGLFHLRIESLQGDLTTFSFTQYDGEMDFNLKQFSVELATDETESKFETIMREKVNVLQTGLKHHDFDTPLKPILQLYSPGSNEITCISSGGMFWVEPVRKPVANRTMLTEIYGFRLPLGMIFSQTNDENILTHGNVRWNPVGLPGGNGLHSTYESQGGGYEVTYGFINPSQPRQGVKFELVRLIDSMVLYRRTRALRSVNEDGNDLDFGITMHPTDEYIAEGASPDNVFTLFRYLIFKRIIAASLEDLNPENVVELPEDDIMGFTPYRLATPQGSAFVYGSMETTDVPYSDGFQRKLFNKVDEDEALAERYFKPATVPPFAGDWSAPVFINQWRGKVSLWYVYHSTDKAIMEEPDHEILHPGVAYKVKDVINAIIEQSEIDLELDTPVDMIEGYTGVTLYVVPKTNVTVWNNSQGATRLDLSLYQILSIVKALFNAYDVIVDKKIILLFDYLLFSDDEIDFRTEGVAKRTNKLLHEMSRSVRYRDIEHFRGVKFVWGEETSYFYKGLGIDYVAQNPDLNTYPVKEIVIEEITPDIISGYLNPERYGREGAFVIGLNDSDNKIVTYSHRGFTIPNVWCSMLRALDVWHPLHREYRQGMINFDVPVTSEERNNLINIDAPLDLDKALNLPKTLLIFDYGAGFIADVFLNLNTLYLTGTVRINRANW